jgi:hypothetical protein
VMEVNHLVEQADRSALGKYRKQMAAAVAGVQALYGRVIGSQDQDLKTCRTRMENANVASLLHSIEVKALK